jgi:thioredoxin 1
MAGGDTLILTDAGFEQEVLKSSQPVLVDFWAEGCAPCRQMSPTIDQIATEYAGRVKVGKVDVASNIQTAGRYQVRGVPTLLVFKGGKVVAQKVGAVGKADVKKMLDAHADEAAPTADATAPTTSK